MYIDRDQSEHVTYRLEARGERRDRWAQPVLILMAFVKRLTQAGMPEAQAEVLADSQTKLIDEKLATKQDLKELELRLTIRLGSMVVIAIGVVATLVKLL